MKISIQAVNLPKNGVVVVTVGENKKLGTVGNKLDKALSGALSRAVALSNFEAKFGEVVALNGVSISYDRVVVLGIGKEEELDALRAQSIGGKLFASLDDFKVVDATIIVDGVKKAKQGILAGHLAYGALLRSYAFKDYKKLEANRKKGEITLNKLQIQVEEKKVASDIYKTQEQVAKGVFLARDVVTEPPNILYPASYANRIKKEFSKSANTKVKVLGLKELQKLGMGALLGVGQGSVQESRVAIIEYQGGKNKKAAPIAFVGKGVTFDTGGISIKPSLGMEEMKYDMGGSASVVGVMKALVERKAKVNAVGIVGLVENMPDGNAQRPSDVVTSMSGQTVEVLNTDAEGRLVLADVLWYAQEKYKAKTVINLATLTGAIVIALGNNQYAGLFSNDDTLSGRISESGETSGEKVWRFPLTEAYDKLLDSPIADMQNISAGRGAGSITAAQFLQRFIKDGVAWAHIDIAGVAWDKEGKDVCPKGAVGYGVRLLDTLVANHYES